MCQICSLGFLNKTFLSFLLYCIKWYLNQNEIKVWFASIWQMLFSKMKRYIIWCQMSSQCPMCWQSIVFYPFVLWMWSIWSNSKQQVCTKVKIHQGSEFLLLWSTVYLYWFTLWVFFVRHIQLAATLTMIVCVTMFLRTHILVQRWSHKTKLEQMKMLLIFPQLCRGDISYFSQIYPFFSHGLWVLI